MRTEAKSVALAGADSVRVEIKLGVGELRLAGGARELLEAEFTYNVPEWQPEVDYHVTGGRGWLSVWQPAHARWHGFSLDNVRYEWDLRLNNHLPLELRLALGAGNGEFELGSLVLTALDIEAGAGNLTVDLTGSLALTRLDCEMGAGEVTLDLTGDWKNDLDARIRGGVGRATVRLPRAVGVRVYAKGGIGKINVGGLKREGDAYVNAAYGKSKVTLRIAIEAGIGEINLEPSEYII